ncbi:Uma2 family endonuclease [Streptomyces sp. NPDC048254]|uniref:Uma2 family endonuclease n=1 Tax=Streptomyces sp. NPDC048254 TaxID=3365525 RepID=UPI00371C79ED
MTIADGWVELVQDQIEIPRSARLRLTENGLTLVPVTHAHTTTARRIANQIETGLPGWAAVGEFSVVPPREGYKPEPDAAALPLDQVRSGDSEVSEKLLPFVVEVVSPESRNRDYNTKPGHYALRGIPAYLIVDVLSARWTLLTRPENDEYQHNESGVFGDRIEIPVADQTLTLDSSQFMRI